MIYVIKESYTQKLKKTKTIEKNYIQELKDLKELLDLEIITMNEFNQKKHEILSNK